MSGILHPNQQPNAHLLIGRQPHGLVPDAMLAHLIGVPLPVFGDARHERGAELYEYAVGAPLAELDVVRVETFDIIEALSHRSHAAAERFEREVLGHGQMLLRVSLGLGSYEVH
jgi:hypothetical protein